MRILALVIVWSVLSECMSGGVKDRSSDTPQALPHSHTHSHTTHEHTSNVQHVHTPPTTPTGPTAANPLNTSQHLSPMDIQVEADINARIQNPLLKNITGLPIHFGVVIGTYPRYNDRHYLLPVLTAVRFLLNQSYTHWTLVIAGDHLKDPQDTKLLERMKLWNISDDKFVFVNLPVNETERFMYRKRRKYMPCLTRRGAHVWCHSGTSAINFAIRTAMSIPPVTHITLLGDDDFYFPWHLENVAKAYTLYPDAYFTYSRGYHMGKPYPPPIGKYNVTGVVPLKGESGMSVSSLWSWRLSDNPDIARLFYFYHDFTQAKFDHHNRQQGSLANDADLVDRITKFSLSHQYSNFSLFISTIGGLALPKPERAMCTQLMNSDFDAGNITDVVSACGLQELANELHYGNVTRGNA